MTYEVSWKVNRGPFASTGTAALGALGSSDLSEAEVWQIIREKGGTVHAMVEINCRNAARSASKNIERETLSLAANWRPTGFYTVADLEKMLQATWAVLKVAGDGLDAMNPPTETSRSLRSSISNRYGDSLVYVQAMNDAKLKGIKVLDAPGFKRWVIKAMNEAALAQEHIAYMACQAPWIIPFGMSLMAASIAVSGVARTLATVAVAVGEVVLKIPDAALDLYTYLKWGALGAGALWVLSKRNKT